MKRAHPYRKSYKSQDYRRYASSSRLHPRLAPPFLTASPAPHHQDTHTHIAPPTTSPRWPHLHPICYLIYVCLYGRSQAGAKSSLFRPLPSALFPPLTLCILSSVFTSLCHHHLFHPLCFVPACHLSIPSVFSPSSAAVASCSIALSLLSRSIFPHIPPTRHGLACGWGGLCGRRGALALAAWNLDSDHCPIPLLHRFVVNRSAPDTLPLVPLPAAVSIPPFLCFSSRCSPSPSHRIDNQPRSRPQYSVHRPQRQERE